MLLDVAWLDEENREVIVDTMLLTDDEELELLEEDDELELEPLTALFIELIMDDCAPALTGEISNAPITANLIMLFFILNMYFK